MTPEEHLHMALLEGELALLKDQLDYFARSQDYWRSRFLRDNEELNNWEYVNSVESRIQAGDDLETI